MQKFRSLLFVFFLFLITGCTSSSLQNGRPTHFSNTEIQELAKKNDFLHLYKSGLNSNISKDVEHYVHICCGNDKRKTLRLFKKNGFRVTDEVKKCVQTPYDEGADQGRKTSSKCTTIGQIIDFAPENSRKKYDAIYEAEEVRECYPYLYSCTVYKATLYMVGDKVAKITASTYRDGL